MLFNSIEFAIFLPSVFIIYWFVLNKNLKVQNLLLLVVSYFFYGWWDWRFLSLIFFSSIIDYLVGLQIEKTKQQRKKRILLALSLLVNLGFLGYFKYYNFFIESFIEGFSFFGTPPNIHTISIILPVGISFYTFQTLSYSIDVYKGKMKPCHDLIAFFAYVSFFPQLVAGPIERAGNLLPQFYKPRTFNRTIATDGLRQMLWGFFKKIVIADNCAIHVNQIFSNSENLPASVLILGAIYFAFQIYGDFSGYSDIAIGTARLFGFDLMRNFAYPYFSRDIAEFWRRWHISLSTWFRDYLYIPLGGSKGGTLFKLRNTIIIFVVSGFWHGANWTFIVWGFLNALYFIPLLLSKKNRNNMGVTAFGKVLPSIKEFFQIALTFMLTLIAWIFFRAEDVGHAFQYLGGILSEDYPLVKGYGIKLILPLLLIFIVIEWLQRDKEHALQIEKLNPFIRYVTYFGVFILIFAYGNFSKTEFIYFAF